MKRKQLWLACAAAILVGLVVLNAARSSRTPSAGGDDPALSLKNLALLEPKRLLAKVGGQGRLPAVEIMINTPTVKKMIEENRLDKLSAAIETGGDDGMINFNQALFNLVKEGKVTEKEALAKASNPQALEMNFKGIFLDEGRRILS